MIGLAAFLAAGSAAAASASDKINSEATIKAYDDIRDAVAHLADVTAHAHAAMQTGVTEIGARALQIGGGQPKVSASEAVRSLLGLG